MTHNEIASAFAFSGALFMALASVLNGIRGIRPSDFVCAGGAAILLMLALITAGMA